MTEPTTTRSCKACKRPYRTAPEAGRYECPTCGAIADVGPAAGSIWAKSPRPSGAPVERTWSARGIVGSILLVSLLALFGFILHVSSHSDSTQTSSDPVKANCELNWAAHRNDSLLSYTHAGYISECVSSMKALQQYVNDHRP